jgi:hypothetical protein
MLTACAMMAYAYKTDRHGPEEGGHNKNKTLRHFKLTNRLSTQEGNHHEKQTT